MTKPSTETTTCTTTSSKTTTTTKATATTEASSATQRLLLKEPCLSGRHQNKHRGQCRERQGPHTSPRPPHEARS
ncbi:Os03g0309250 [Oryza sativa Japonica Group]|uniref:Os03g0309250 protein n=1 Tax=Oryza sativa subsp. japonica TaxID=39947 RepID=A0A0P0VWJ3_ORYSJ|nr:hypothetical protein EE612_016991 [Oryza sativa]BAS83846.1 Os03g0309250 [Oryza sativa Japonica Group]